MEDLVISALVEIDVFVQGSNTEACHRFGKPDKRNSQKTIVHFINWKTFKKVLVNKKNFAILIAAYIIYAKYKFKAHE